MKILVIHGPNLNLLGVREPDIYGVLTMDEINRRISSEAEKCGVEIDFYQSNHEGAIVDRIQECMGRVDGIVMNPAAYTHYSIAIRDAIAAVKVPTVEVHLSEIQEREEFRHVSVIRDVCVKQIAGKGVDSYLEALRYLASEFLPEKEENRKRDKSELE